MERSKRELLDRVGGWPPADREWHPSETSWSLADVVEHCFLVEAGIRTALAKEPNPDKPRVVSAARWLRWGVTRFILKAGIRYRAPVEAILPRRTLAWDALLANWEVERRELRRWLEEADPRIQADPRFRHPLTGWLNVPQTVTFIADHLEHHLAQVGRIEVALRHRGG